ncbi:methyltransferase domain-containing protein [Parvularcula sp. IMCC14364]|uniref:methyltransferase domain-containing protein n=1 Tax=Parvularcula sp. IMCC14364 TaxID=3067902 RepID=UPI002741C9C9|nr:methyltransferase domain-containing protein [Parvularcula sp. IMCC14364]
MTGKLVTRCRACGSKSLSPAFSLGDGRDYVFCDPDKDVTACGLLQQATMTQRDDNAVCEGVSRSHRHRLRAAVSEAMEMVTTRDGLALDIGCGDGTLTSFYPRWIEAVSVDVVTPVEGASDWAKVVTGAFPEKPALSAIRKHAGNRKFDIITAISVLGEQSAPGQFLLAIREQLVDDGIAIVETTYASLALMRNHVDAFHEQAEAVYTLTNLEAEVRKAGLKIVRGAMTETNGGSIRLFLAHDGYAGHDYVPWLEQLARLWDEESVLNLANRATFQAFIQRVERNKSEMADILDNMERYNLHAHVIGADTAMRALLDTYGINGNHVSFVIGRGPDEGRTPRNLPVGDGFVEVVAEEDVRLAQPDYLFGCASQRREILEHWRDAIFNGVKVVFLTPEVEIIDDRNYGAELGKALAVTDGPGSVDTLKAVLSTVRRPRLVAVNTALEA